MHIISGKNVLPPKFTELLRVWFPRTSKSHFYRLCKYELF